MTDSISITIPMERKALTRAAEMLTGLASDILAKLAETPKIDAMDQNFDTPEQTFDVVKGLNDIVEEITPTNNVIPMGIPSAVELDADGLPWDVRIHSKNKSKLSKTSQWKKKRGVDAELVATVEAELRGAMSAGIVDDTHPPMLTNSGGMAVPQSETIIPPPVITPAIAETPAPAIVETAITFPEIMSKITAAQAAGTLTDVQVLAALNAQGLASLPLLAVRPDLVPSVNAALFG